MLAAFPKAYAVVLSALYLPVLLMLIALVFLPQFFGIELSGWEFGQVTTAFVLFLLAQKHIVAGLTAGAVKG